MLDIKFIRENPSVIKENIKKKFQNQKLPLVDELINRDEQWRKNKQILDSLRHERNKLTEQVTILKKQGKNADILIKKAASLPGQIKQLEKRLEEDRNRIDEILVLIPNIIHKSVPVGKDEKQNKIIKKWGKIPKYNFPVKNHVQLLEKNNFADFDTSSIVSGNGFYYLKSEMALLNQALIRFAIDFMHSKKYIYIEPPLMIRKDVAEAAGDLTAFELALYKIENENLYLIPTAEHAILGMLKQKTLEEGKLPLKFFGYSMCFRKEIGAHGINEKGLWRTHQFNKIEQFIFCKPEDSYKYYEELRKNSEELYKKLKLPYRILESCSGDLGDWKSKSEDIEIYRPTTKKYEEIGSLSNCTDYQARRLNIKYFNKEGERVILHTLNNTAIATSRTMVAIIENYQQKDGSIKIPAALQKYMGGIKKIGGYNENKPGKSKHRARKTRRG